MEDQTEDGIKTRHSKKENQTYLQYQGLLQKQEGELYFDPVELKLKTIDISLVQDFFCFMFVIYCALSL